MRHLIFVFVLFSASLVKAQPDVINRNKHDYDSLYYAKLPQYFTLKLVSFTKYSDFNLADNNLPQKLKYYAHPGPSLGVGMHYRWLGLIVSAGVNPANDSLYEKSRRFDLQSYLFLRRLTVQFYSSAYSGYYLQQPEQTIIDWPQYKPYSRSDIKTRNFGFSGTYIFNSGRFSNRAGTLQSEWQKKSAGSLIAGFTMLYNHVKADSAIIPQNLINQKFFNDTNFIQSKQFAVGGQAGYAFTLVLRQHFFVNFSMMGGISLGRQMFQIDSGNTMTDNKPGFVLINSAGLGYNSRQFYLGFYYVNLVSTTPTPVINTSIDYNTGKFQAVLAYRFKIREHRNILPDWLPFKL